MSGWPGTAHRRGRTSCDRRQRFGVAIAGGSARRTAEVRHTAGARYQASTLATEHDGLFDCDAVIGSDTPAHVSPRPLGAHLCNGAGNGRGLLPHAEGVLNRMQTIEADHRPLETRDAAPRGRRVRILLGLLALPALVGLGMVVAYGSLSDSGQKVTQQEFGADWPLTVSKGDAALRDEARDHFPA